MQISEMSLTLPEHTQYVLPKRRETQTQRHIDASHQTSIVYEIVEN